MKLNKCILVAIYRLQEYGLEMAVFVDSNKEIEYHYFIDIGFKIFEVEI